MKFEEMWFIFTLLTAIRRHPMLGKSLHGEIKERQILQELGWIDHSRCENCERLK